MIYYGIFTDIKGQDYRVSMTTSSSSEMEQITLGDTPVMIETQSTNLLDPMKPRTCTIQIVTDKFLPDLYTPVPDGILVSVDKIKDYDGESFSFDGNLFTGFVTPCMYSMGYTYVDTIEVEAVDCLSTLKYYDYTPYNDTSIEWVSLYKILYKMLRQAGYTGSMYMQYSLVRIGWADGVSGYDSSLNITDKICVNEGNFYDDDENNTPWSCFEVVEEICKFLGCSCVPRGRDVFFIDYRYTDSVSSQYGRHYFYKTDLAANEPTVETGIYLDEYYRRIEGDDYAPGAPTLSLDEVYNKIEITSNTYDIEDLAPAADDQSIHISLNKECGEDISYSAEYYSTRTRRTGFLGLGKKKHMWSYSPSYYSAFCRLDPESGWTHRFWHMPASTASGWSMSPVALGDNTVYYDRSSNTICTTGMNRYMNCYGAFMCHYTFDGIAKSGGMSECIYFHTADDTCTNKPISFFTNRAENHPVLIYHSPEKNMYKPATGTTWITIKGDLQFQRNEGTYDDREDLETEGSSLYVVDPDGDDFDNVPYDEAITVRDDNGNSHTFEAIPYYNGLGVTGHWRTKDNSSYGDGFKFWKFKLQIGDKFWNGSSWTTSDSSFYLSHTCTNSRQNKNEREEPMTRTWMNLVGNRPDYYNKTGDVAYAIPIAAGDDNAPSIGEMTLTMYAPRYVPVEMDSLFAGVTDKGWKRMGPGIYASGFNLGIKYIAPDSDSWWSHEDETVGDIVYSNVIDEEYCNEFDEIELKINTAFPDKPISKSFISNGERYVSTTQRTGGEMKTQEKQLIDMYYEHYSKPCRIYTFNTWYAPAPYTCLTFRAVGGKYYVDTDRFDLRRANHEIKAVEYAAESSD